VLRDEIADETGNVLGTRAEGRQLDREDVEPVIGDGGDDARSGDVPLDRARVRRRSPRSGRSDARRRFGGGRLRDDGPVELVMLAKRTATGLRSARCFDALS
jgi:hypothetical protein